MNRLILIILLGLWADSAFALNLKNLREKYQRLVSLEASVKQVKEAPYLLRPLTSKIKFAYNKGEVKWHIVSPVESKLSFNRSGITIDGKKQSDLRKPGQSQQSFSTLIETLLDLLEGKLPSDAESLSINKKNDTLVWNPGKKLENKQGAEPTPSLVFSFNKDLIVDTVSINHHNETTTLFFEKATFKFSDPKMRHGK